MANCADKLITLTMGKSKQIGLESELAVLSLKEKLDMLSWSITFLVIGLIAGGSGTQRYRRYRDPHCMDFVRCLSGSFCGQSRYGPPTARVTDDR